MDSNKVVYGLLRNNGWNASNANKIVNDLIVGEIIEADKLSEPEKLVFKAKKWLGVPDHPCSEYSFNTAAGWSTNGWEHVTDDTFEHFPVKTKYIFEALVIMAKEAGVEL